ncbi:MAG: tRNA (adenosine(37)-N6)-threonylcarbamoyltransferase complex ATPase subunit type 1 TsaE [Candidatus Nealsonbacteria bacterium CG10_big_fil_rev_8_21_14_0_10_36_24]|uniref:tRNA threonylcarbamoyladenosine biosynthesis protein TsaE n=2 Tax=Candidatus Nealsoniibacteriota TaxID=1817911 RepID=A0A2H0YP31_9BACT|nr:MAG: tRNA (adenosine(37)-N6)-threonylcarbamoyltransferase complex ATPase subunit type 1 TsaE [Candidatus Nealsonbacteria bacterium CG10_big_fil_rev_8_21_14_0_10_36_24]PIS40186.1 MAG: tRNA (adenosine(37)-N6)-threonylcarbamoyltransferase complex ATPase subunit type 1 TsaE [Candidatus Nealsonbacteria bacterium CG08_land_8_20_14_0_20_36_22]
MKKEYITSSSAQTKKLGQKLAKDILKKKPEKTAFVIGLEGELGSGKTTFVQGFAKALGIKEKVLSPTFVIIKRFQFNNLTIKQFNNFYHLDCYRIKKPRELLDLGFKEIISNPRNIVAVEWADKIKKIMPEDVLWINFEFIDEKKRKISFICDIIEK